MSSLDRFLPVGELVGDNVEIHPVFEYAEDLSAPGIFYGSNPTTPTSKFRQYNLIYGFNGCGKTTLSRFFSSISMGYIHPNLPGETSFKFRLSNNRMLGSMELNNSFQNILFVFNVDFIEKNLQWSVGTARPIFYIGEKQAEKAIELKQLVSKMNDLNNRIHYSQSDDEAREREFSLFKRDTARLIAEELRLGRSYVATQLANDYSAFVYDSRTLLSDNKIAEHKGLLAQESPLPRLEYITSDYSDLIERVRSIIETLEFSVGKIAIAEIQSHPEMLQWLNEGIKYHLEHELSECLFCGQALPLNKLETLKDSIDNRYNEILVTIQDIQTKITSIRESLLTLPNKIPSTNDIVVNQQDIFSRSVKMFQVCLDKGIMIMESLLEALSKKFITPNIPINSNTYPTESDIISWHNSFLGHLETLNLILTNHNQSHDEFQQIQLNIRSVLKSHYLTESYKEFHEKQQTCEESQSNLSLLLVEHNELNELIEQTKHEIQDHGPAAESLNLMIAKYLGHNELVLFAHSEGYEVRRNGKLVIGCLSEGEKTAVALCYFLCLLKAEGREIQNLIVILDDPISSLDTNALNYTFNLIKTFLEKAGQLFIFTHNLAFMNECKKWLKKFTPKGIQRNRRISASEAEVEAKASLLFLDSRQDPNIPFRHSIIQELPSLLQEYESEYHYLFSIVWAFNNDESQCNPYQYLMPNAMRKLLEIFLTFRIPGSSGLSDKITQLSEDQDYCSDLNNIEMRALDRLIQIESHADNLDDIVSFSSMTIEETKKAALTLFEVMRIVDIKHFNRMCKIC